VALFKFLAKIFKKIAKLFGGRKGKAAEASDREPGERRIGIFGPSAVGKTVFFTMLYNACTNDREFNLAPNDPRTGADLLRYLNTLRDGEWPTGTVDDLDLNFRASLRGGSAFPFSSKDYKGELVDLEQESPERAELIAYFRDCDSILFLLSPEMIADPRRCEREILNFQTMINLVTETGGRGLRIPIGLMITKADTIPGFENEHQARLIGRNSEYLKAKSFVEFVDGLCEQDHIKQNIVFQEQVRTILQSMSIFFDFLMTLSMEFQVFFLSSVGHVRTETAADGNSLVKPPENPRGIGVKRPFLWVVDTIRERERIARFNAVRRGVFSLALMVLVIYSLVYGMHLLPGRRDFRQMIDVSEDETMIQRSLADYPERWTIGLNSVFPLPGSHLGDIRTDARRLRATFEAEQFLRNDFTATREPAELAELVAAFETDQNAGRHSWFHQLTYLQQQQVLTTMAQVVAAHNLNTARRIAELKDRYGGADQTAPDNAVARCDSLRRQLVQPPRNLEDFDRVRYYDKLVEAASLTCELLVAKGNAKQYQSTWIELQDQLPGLCIGAPNVEAFQSYYENVVSLGSGLTADASQHGNALSAKVAQFRDLLEVFLGGIDESEQEAARKQKLRRVANGAGDQYRALGNYAGRLVRIINADANNAELGDLALRIERLLTPTPQWAAVLSSELERSVRKAGGLTGARAEARQLYLSNLDHLRNEGELMTMRIDRLPEGCAMTVWDADANRFSYDQSLESGTLPVRWRVGRKIKLAVLRHGLAGDPEYCPRNGYEEFLPGLHGVEQELRANCPPGTAGFIMVVFPDFESLVETRLIEPLRIAFPVQ